ncbi:MAG TPA: histidine ammonia-lyase [Gemmatales bacterium]|nr:histidine ammonia-lyase [Gemmatales bacterium]
MNTIHLTPGTLTLAELKSISRDTSLRLTLSPDCFAAIDAAHECVKRVLTEGRTVYGVNTGFGLLANTRIHPEELELLQRSIVLSHAAGVGKPIDESTVRLILALKINSLARGYSGVRRELIEALVMLFNEQIYPIIPEKGSVGASGDLAPLAHLALVLIGEGQAHHHDQIITGQEAMQRIGLAAFTLAPKEGLALLNGTQVSTAFALQGLFAAEDIFHSALVAGAMSVEAAQGSRKPFDARIHEVRGLSGQSDVAKVYRTLLDHSEIEKSHEGCDKVQDPYSLRCQPQVMGACLMQLRHAAGILATEANGVSDNPLIFADTDEIISGGNFHAEPVALVADNLALVLAEIGSLSERRTALLIDKNLSGLPPFLVENGGVNSGFMIAQVTAAALVSENKSLAHPASVDSIPTSANQEDHVSMATYAGRRLLDMAYNSASIVAIELLAAAQGLDFRLPCKTSPLLEQARGLIRKQVQFFDHDRYFAPDIQAVTELVQKGFFNHLVQPTFTL